MRLTEARGVVEIKRASGRWTPAWPPEELEVGDRVRTGLGAGARLSFDDGTAAELEAESALAVEQESEVGTGFFLERGSLRSWVPGGRGRRFAVRTAAMSALSRGIGPTDFLTRVMPGGQTVVEVAEGAVGLEDARGRRSLLKAMERTQIGLRGLEKPRAKPGPVEARALDFRAEARAEAAYALAQDQLDSVPAREARLGEYQQGRALVDIAGARVRVEEYVVRPRADQFKRVALDGRSGRLDYFYYLVTFNRSLPADLEPVGAMLPGCKDRSCDYYLTEFYAGRSNGTDSILEHGVNTLGGQIDVNNNSSGADDVASLFSAGINGYEDVTGHPVYQTIFNADTVAASNADPITGAPATAANAWLDPATGQLAVRSVSLTAPAADALHRQVYESYSDGSYLAWNGYAADREGRVPPGAALDDAAYRTGSLRCAYEQAVTSSHFGGRKIDLVVDPRFLVEAGLLR